jgi:hypothetical protein
MSTGISRDYPMFSALYVLHRKPDDLGVSYVDKNGKKC